MYLNEIARSKIYKIKDIKAIDLVKRRLYDIGIHKNSKIRLLYISPSKKMKAYLINNSIIAIRDKEASFIEVKDD